MIKLWFSFLIFFYKKASDLLIILTPLKNKENTSRFSEANRPLPFEQAYSFAARRSTGTMSQRPKPHMPHDGTRFCTNVTESRLEDQTAKGSRRCHHTNYPAYSNLTGPKYCQKSTATSHRCCRSADNVEMESFEKNYSSDRRHQRTPPHNPTKSPKAGKN